MSDAKWVVFGEHPITVDEVVAIARGDVEPRLSTDAAFRARLDAGTRALRTRLDAGERIYGVTTGFGESCLTDVPADCTADLPLNLVRYHGCGTGVMLDETQSAAVVAARLASLATGWSRGVRPSCWRRLCGLLDPRHPAAASRPRARSARAAISRRCPTSRRCWWASARSSSRAACCPAAEALRRRARAARAAPEGEPRDHERHRGDDRRSPAWRSSAPRRLARLARHADRAGQRRRCAATRRTSTPASRGKPHPGQHVARWMREDLGSCPTGARSRRGSRTATRSAARRT